MLSTVYAVEQYPPPNSATGVALSHDAQWGSFGEIAAIHVLMYALLERSILHVALWDNISLNLYVNE